MNALLFIAGPCVIEDEGLIRETAAELKALSSNHGVNFVFKASYDKANRTAVDSFRGPGRDEGLRILANVKEHLGLPVLSDIHSPEDAAAAGAVLDMLQIPAFLSRQTDLLTAAGRTGKPINIKKAQFMAPEDMQYAAAKVASTGNTQIFLCERGTSFGYHNLVVDFRAFSLMRSLGYPVIFDATHSVQIPSQGGKSSGRREYVRPLARAAAAYGIDGLFIETHPNPDHAKSDGPNMLPLAEIDGLLKEVLSIRAAMAGPA